MKLSAQDRNNVNEERDGSTVYRHSSLVSLARKGKRKGKWTAEGERENFSLACQDFYRKLQSRGDAAAFKGCIEHFLSLSRKHPLCSSCRSHTHTHSSARTCVVTRRKLLLVIIKERESDLLGKHTQKQDKGEAEETRLENYTEKKIKFLNIYPYVVMKD